MKGDGKRPDFEIIRINHAYNTLKKGEKEEIDFITYKAIIKKFLIVYINELFFLNKAMYFPLLGKARLNKCGNWIRKDTSNNKVAKEGKLKSVGHSLGIYWYHRPFNQWYYYRLKKMTGRTSLIPVLEKKWKESFDIELLKKASELKKDPEFNIVKKLE